MVLTLRRCVVVYLTTGALSDCTVQSFSPEYVEQRVHETLSSDAFFAHIRVVLSEPDWYKLPKMLTDTSKAAEAVQNSLFSRLTNRERLQRVCFLSDWVLGLSKAAIAKKNPDLTEKERSLIFVEIHYGKALADKVRNYLQTYGS